MRSRVALPLLCLLSVVLAVPVATAQESPPTGGSDASRSAEPVETVVRVRVPSTDALRRMAADGLDVTHDVAQGPNGTFDATVIVPGGDVALVRRYDGRVLATLPAPTQAELTSELKGNARELTAAQKQRAKPPATTAESADPGGDRPPPQAPDATLTVLRADRWNTPDGHFLSVEVRSELGEEDEVTVETDTGETYELSPFVDRGVYLYHRMTEPVATGGAVESISAESSDGTWVESPTSEWAGGDVTRYPPGFEWGFTDDGYVNAVQSDAVVERLAEQYPDLTEVVELPNETHGYNVPRGNKPLLAPQSYPREPYTVKALRIGADRDGSQTGVLLYAQEHAREWVTSLVALETAQRLLHNYGSDPTTTALVDDLDIFIVPMVNPDGAAYSLYDNRLQRTNMNVDGCDEAVTPLNAGIDINRNFSVGSFFDGFVGSSPDCESAVYTGESELSEAESSNEVWLTEQFPNIRFAMNTHSYGGYFMWSPAAYKPDRTTLPRPDLATEQYFFEASETILSRIKQFRGSVVWPGRTGPVVDVLYSAAGNSGDEHFYDEQQSTDPDIYAWDFEVGVPLWNDTTQTWDTTAGGLFWPDFETEGFHQAMEFANGWYGILEVARRFALDDAAPTSTNNVDGRGTYSGPVDIFFDTTEPATVHYTLDGSRPTSDSPTVQQDGIRGGAAPVTISEPGATELRWFSVDEAGNAEEPHREVIKIR